MTDSRAPEAAQPPSAEPRPIPDLADLARVEANLEEVRFEAKLAGETNARLTREVHRLEQLLIARRSEAEALRGRLAERESYVTAIHGSFAWKAVEGLRGLLGRRWSR